MNHLPPLVILSALASVAALAQPPFDAAATVEAARVVEAEVQTGQRIVGTVQPLRDSTIGGAVEGRLDDLLVNDGQQVQQGEVLAKLRPVTLQLQLSAAQAELRMFQSQLEELQNGSLPEEIAEAEANMLAAKALMVNADRQWKRLQTLSISNAASVAELEDAKEQAEATRFAHRASEQAFQRIKNGPRLELIAQAQARVDLQQERVKQLDDQIEKLEIKAPFDGYVAAEMTEVGAWINRGDPTVRLVQLDVVEILVPVTAESVVNLKRGDQIRVEFPELPTELFVGTIDRIVPVADQQTRTFPVYVRMENRIDDGRPLLMSGMLARVNLPTGSTRPSPLVPKDALVLNGKEKAVFVFQGNSAVNKGLSQPTGKVRKVSVDLGVALGGMIQVRGQIAKDDLVVVTGNERLVDGDEVKVVSVKESESPESISSSQ